MKKLVLLFACLLGAVGGSAQLANLDFEEWATDTLTLNVYPVGWPLIEHSYLERDSVAQHGDYALKVSIWYYYVKTVAEQVAPIHGRPVALSGHYRYEDHLVERDHVLVEDTALASIYLTRWNAGLMRRDTVGHGMLDLLATPEYRAFNCPVHYVSSDMPDSVRILLDPSLLRRDTAHYYFSPSPMGFSSFLTIDNLSLDGLVGVGEAVDGGSGLLLYPNPAVGHVELVAEDAAARGYVVVDLGGRVCRSGVLRAGKARVDVDDLDGAVYLMRVLDGKGGILGTERLIHIK